MFQLCPIYLKRCIYSLRLYSRLRLEALKSREPEEHVIDPAPNTNRAENKSALAKESTLLPYILSPNEKVRDVIFDTERPGHEKHVYTCTPIRRLCAQELFSLFMLQLAAAMGKLKGGAIRRKALRGDEQDVLRWNHPAL
jgi:hypothetical protein